MRPLDELMLMKVPECRCGISSMAAVDPGILNAACERPRMCTVIVGG
jgi:hypothetical protein